MNTELLKGDVYMLKLYLFMLRLYIFFVVWLGLGHKKTFGKGDEKIMWLTTLLGSKL